MKKSLQEVNTQELDSKINEFLETTRISYSKKLLILMELLKVEVMRSMSSTYWVARIMIKSSPSKIICTHGATIELAVLRVICKYLEILTDMAITEQDNSNLEELKEYIKRRLLKNYK